MKKSILIIICLVTAFFFIVTNEVTAQWEVTVSWNDTECDCGTITAKTLYLKITDLETPEVIVDTSYNITNHPYNYYVASGNETIKYDCQDCYLVEAAVLYEDTSKCCEGYESETVDGQELIDGYDLPEIEMY